MPMSGISPQHSSYMMGNQKNEQHSQLINLNGGATRRQVMNSRKGGKKIAYKYKKSTRTKQNKKNKKKTK
jgi:hypothetical protein